MTDIVKLLREAAAHGKAVAHWGPNDATLSVLARLTAAADELEASAEWALCKWLAEDGRRRLHMWQDSLGPWTTLLIQIAGPEVYGDADTRADAIRAALKAWEER